MSADPSQTAGAGGPGPPADGSLLNGRYRLGDVLGRGGMGIVYRAEDTLLGRTVAIKILHAAPRDTDRALRRLRREARNSALLQHPNNVRLYELCEVSNDCAFIAMEFVLGTPLSQVPMPLAEASAVRIAAQVCCAIAEAHGHGLVHRDLKPQNIMLSEVDGREFARVLDYGISTSFSASSQSTHDGDFVGTVLYAAPEQAEGQRATPATDIYALGVMLFEMLVGRVPFDGESPSAVLYQHVNRIAPRVREFCPQLHEGLDALVAACLSKRPADRPSSAVVLRNRLMALLPELSTVQPDNAAVVAHDIESLSTADALPVVRGGRCEGHRQNTPGAVPVAAISTPALGVPSTDAPRPLVIRRT